jgi:hypothetical protein
MNHDRFCIEQNCFGGRVRFGRCTHHAKVLPQSEKIRLNNMTLGQRRREYAVIASAKTVKAIAHFEYEGDESALSKMFDEGNDNAK